MANPFEVRVPSALESLMAFDKGNEWGQQQGDRRAVRQAGTALGGGNYEEAAKLLFNSGKLDAGLTLLKMSQEQKNSSQFNDGISRLYGGKGGGSPLTQLMAPAPQALVSNKVYANDESSPLDPPSGKDRDLTIRTILAEAGNQGPVGQQAVAGVIRNRAVAGNFGGDTPTGVVTSPNQFEPWNTATGRGKMAAIDPNSPQYQAAAGALDRAYAGEDPTGGATHFYSPKTQAALGRSAPKWDNGAGLDIGDHRFFGGSGSPQVTAGASPTEVSAQSRPGGPASGQKAMFLIQALSSPNVSAGQKEVAKLLLAEEIKVNPEIQKLEAFRKDPGLMQLAIELKKAGSTNISIDQKGEAKFDEEFGKKQADRWNKYIESADSAERKLVDIGTLRQISQRMGSQGSAADVKEAIGPFAEALGVNIEGLSDIQAYSSIIQRLAPQQRAPGSGSTSDIEFKGFLRSMPMLSQHPAAREVTLNTMEALARDEVSRGEIATKLATGEIKRGEAEKMMRSLPDPLKAFSDWRKANPGVYGEATRGGASTSQGGEKPPVQGARQGNDGGWYVPDPARPGKYLQVR